MGRLDQDAGRMRRVETVPDRLGYAYVRWLRVEY